MDLKVSGISRKGLNFDAYIRHMNCSEISPDISESLNRVWKVDMDTFNRLNYVVRFYWLVISRFNIHSVVIDYSFLPSLMA